jgi:hypothetical protein
LFALLFFNVAWCCFSIFLNINSLRSD